MRLKVKSSLGKTAILGETLTPASTLKDLTKAIQAAFPLSNNLAYSFRIGFPPKLLVYSNYLQTLADLKVNNGDQIILEEIVINLDNRKESSLLDNNSQPSEKSLPTTPNQINPINPINPIQQLESIAVGDGMLIVREMKDDNSCLFRSIGYVTSRSVSNLTYLRQIIVDAILSDPFEYNEAILGRDPLEYCNWIKKDQSWGGAIELSIFSKHFQIEINSIDVQSLRVDKFGGDKFTSKVFIIYSGIHYDAIALSPMLDGPEEFDQTSFDKTGVGMDEFDRAAVELGRIWKAKHRYTDVANFTLRCGVCKIGVVGEKDALAHAKATKHSSFEEYT